MTSFSGQQRQQLLKTKLLRNKQKLAAKSLIRELFHSSSLHELGVVLERAELIFYPETEQIIKSWFWPNSKIDSDGWYKGDNRPQSYLYEAFSAHMEVVEKVSCVTFSKNFGTSCYLYFDDSHPIFEVPASSIESFMVELAQKFDLGFAVVEKQNKFGLIVSHYGGYLKGKFTADEIVYNITTWT